MWVILQTPVMITLEMCCTLAKPANSNTETLQKSNSRTVSFYLRNPGVQHPSKRSLLHHQRMTAGAACLQQTTKPGAQARGNGHGRLNVMRQTRTLMH
jgi:hypothetical protein